MKGERRGELDIPERTNTNLLNTLVMAGGYPEAR